MGKSKSFEIGKLPLKVQWKALLSIFKKYIFRNRPAQLLVVPFFLFIILSKFVEIKAVKLGGDLTKIIGNTEISHQRNSAMLYVLYNFIFFAINEGVSYIFSAPIQKAWRESTKETFEQFVSLRFSTFNDIGTGEIYSRIERRGLAIYDILDVVVIEAAPIVISIALFLVQIQDSLGFLVPALMLLFLWFFLLATFAITQRRTKIRQQLNLKINDQNNLLYDILSNYEAVLAYNNRDLEVHRFDSKLKGTEKEYTSLYKSLFVLNFVQRLLFLVFLLIVFYLGIYGVGTKEFTPESFMAFIGFVRSICHGLFKSGYLYGRYSIALLNYCTSEVSKDLENYAGEIIQRFTDKIELKNVGIYHGSRNILSDVNLTINKGDKVAVVGRNGIGKSSLVKSILGFTSFEGQMLIDGKDFRSLSIKSIRSLISYIHQDSAIYNDTVKYNILYGNRNMTDLEITDLCKKIDVHESIERLQNGYNTIAGERGSSLSGGEKQKIAFARAAAKNGDILILDEPTASLDKHSEALILTKIIQYFDKRTVIMIIHNLNLLKMFNKIVYVADKNTIEIGDFDSLMADNSSFKAFYENFQCEV
ncbi:hypothetical protein EDEG_01438 [Edhazardia aedis USNM 41457]|uniref:ABC transporter domain-containing protein n=1 Tax=Edhazardia aedis (strain USNM 41457) TaxID=1003232 RepID=J9D9X5_EDHAE|nr:hypothetical protein EDEG_01438 [Edhazardia aedis USNM 41457]|eukprot:EJW04314.1 hypothetical protein EDEG_01438 [Edhazardia aedis USNM 41457]